MNKQNNIRNKEIKNFLDEVASKNPTPGGGAVAALIGAVAAALVEMVCELTKTPCLIGRRAKLQESKTQSKILREKLLQLADEDCKAFDGVIAAYKTKDKLKIKKALQKAISVPEKTALLSNEVLELAKIVLKKGNKNALSDAKTALFLGKAARLSALENVNINRRAIDNL